MIHNYELYINHHPSNPQHPPATPPFSHATVVLFEVILQGGPVAESDDPILVIHWASIAMGGTNGDPWGPPKNGWF